VVAVGIREDGSGTIDAATEKIREARVGDCELSEREALCRMETDTDEPVVERSIAPLKPIAAMLTVVLSAMRLSSARQRFKDSSRSRSFDTTVRCPSVSREVAVCRDETDRPGEFG
jgi:hypothetical protein